MSKISFNHSCWLAAGKLERCSATRASKLLAGKALQASRFCQRGRPPHVQPRGMPKRCAAFIASHTMKAGSSSQAPRLEFSAQKSPNIPTLPPLQPHIRNSASQALILRGLGMRAAPTSHMHCDDRTQLIRNGPVQTGLPTLLLSLNITPSREGAL